MQKKSIYLSIVGVLVAAAAGFAVFTQGPDKTQDNATTSTTQQTTQPTIAYEQEGKLVKYQGQTGKTALEVLKALTVVETKDTSFGEQVMGINGLKADEKKEYWAFYVNGKPASEGAGTYDSKDSDKIEWRLEKL